MPKKFYKRDWLNSKEGSAFVEASVVPDYNGVYGALKLADCNKVVHIEFDYNKKTYNERMKKLDKLIKTLTDFRASMVEHKELAK